VTTTTSPRPISERDLLGPGPCNPNPDATPLAAPLLGHRDPDFPTRHHNCAAAKLDEETRPTRHHNCAAAKLDEETRPTRHHNCTAAKFDEKNPPDPPPQLRRGEVRRGNRLPERRPRTRTRNADRGTRTEAAEGGPDRGGRTRLRYAAEVPDAPGQLT
jgi:hypothetical protein